MMLARSLDIGSKRNSTGLASSRVLVVEDDPDIRAMTVSVLEAAGAEVYTAASASEATALLDKHSFHALILDWHLSNDTGASLLLTLQERRPELFARSAVVTGDVLSIPGHEEAERLGRPVLAKPFRPKQLISTVLDLIS